MKVRHKVVGISSISNHFNSRTREGCDKIPQRVFLDSATLTHAPALGATANIHNDTPVYLYNLHISALTDPPLLQQR